jgi:small-conductance mechanosensitive channel
METVGVLIVLLVVLGIFGGVGYLFIRETGTTDLREQARLWLTAPRQLRRTTSTAPPAPSTTPPAQTPVPQQERTNAAMARATDDLPRLSERPAAAMRDDEALRRLREEVQGELRGALGRTGALDARLVRLEDEVKTRQANVDEQSRTLAELDQARARQGQEIGGLRNDLAELKRALPAMGPFGQRRGEALAELYSQLARVEAALGSVVNPVLLPGEPIQLPDEFFPETLSWESWKEVGDRAFAFGDAFSQHRIALDAETAAAVERFVATLRQALTGAVYPSVKDASPSLQQLRGMRAALQEIIAALPTVRQRLEASYRTLSG